MTKWLRVKREDTFMCVPACPAVTQGDLDIRLGIIAKSTPPEEATAAGSHAGNSSLCQPITSTQEGARRDKMCASGNNHCQYYGLWKRHWFKVCAHISPIKIHLSLSWNEKVIHCLFNCIFYSWTQYHFPSFLIFHPDLTVCRGTITRLWNDIDRPTVCGMYPWD